MNVRLSGWHRPADVRLLRDVPGQPLLMYLDRIAALYSGMGALPQGATVPAQLSPLPSRQVSRPRCASPAWWLTPAGALGWMTTRGFAVGLASASAALAVATTVIAIADGDLIIVALVPGALGAATMGGLVAVRRPGHPMGLLLCAIALTAAVCDVTFAYGRGAVLHFPGSLPGGHAPRVRSELNGRCGPNC